MLSLAGLPPLPGFFGKFYLFAAAMRAGSGQGLLWLVALALFGSLISLYYYLIVLKVIFLDEGETAPDLNPAGAGLDADFFQKISIAIVAMLVLFLGLFPGSLLARILAAIT
jgi:NADH-quinone oxidoreductase subunit N